MTDTALTIQLGQCSDKGRKPVNQDSIGACIPRPSVRAQKGIAVALADGISSSDVSQIASETAVSGFLQDYYATSPAWSVKRSANCVLQATNAWLHSQTQNSPRRFDKDKGYIATFSALVLKGRRAHIFHAGDARVYRLNGGALEQLTRDHRRTVSDEVSYLTRAMGVDAALELDYCELPLECGDTFMLASDGLYEWLDESELAAVLAGSWGNANALARKLVERARDAGSGDNLSVQLVRVDTLPDGPLGDWQMQAQHLPLPPGLSPRMVLDGYRIVRELYISSRSHAFLAVDQATDRPVVLKTPSVEKRSDPAYLERFLVEEWVARRVDSPHLLKVAPQDRRRSLYLVAEYIEGQTLAQWMRDNPAPSLAAVRDIVAQIARGLQALHRQEMIHQDLRPENVMIDTQGTVKLIDFGAVRIAGVAGINDDPGEIPGTAQFAAPEYFVGAPVDARSDIFSLGVLCYRMLTGALPYGTAIAKTHSAARQRQLNYHSLLIQRPDVPAWVDDAIARAVQVTSGKRYREPSELVADLHRPNRAFVQKHRPPLIERNPLLFWQCLALLLVVVIVWQWTLL